MGRDLGELSQVRGLLGLRVSNSIEELLGRNKPDLAFHTTVSSFKDAYTQIEPLVERGISVVSSCEELIFPQLREPGLTRKLDRICKRTGARVVATGINPGFVMDLLPLCLTSVTREVRAICIERVVNASTRRAPLQRKIGAGLPPALFRRWLKTGKAGHAGLKESLALIAHGLGWKLSSIRETADAVVATRDIQTQYFQVKKGTTCGMRQCAEGKMGGRIVLILNLAIYLEAPDAHDAIRIEGDPPVELTIAGGIAGDAATVAALVNIAPRLLRAPPGLLLVTDLSTPIIG